jgi:hypothetical protein
MSTQHVYESIASVTAALAKEGIQKDRRNQQQGYNFRGIDDVYNALAPLLAAHKLCILPNVECREVTERESGQGKALFYVAVRVNFAFVSAVDGSCHHVVTYGEAMDSADKATNKAMSAAYKYAALQAFCIPTEGDNDADSTTHEVKGRANGSPQANPPPRQSAPAQNAPPAVESNAVLQEIRKASGQPDDMLDKYALKTYGRSFLGLSIGQAKNMLGKAKEGAIKHFAGDELPL